jgi:hypothetical protein
MRAIWFSTALAFTRLPYPCYLGDSPFPGGAI